MSSLGQVYTVAMEYIGDPRINTVGRGGAIRYSLSTHIVDQ